MTAEKLQLKLYAVPGAPLPLETFIPVFHAWIKHKRLPELAIDVANYAHVPAGPGVVLIGDACDYFMDESAGGRLGLLHNRKRHAPAPADRLQDAFRRTVHAALLLEREPALAGKLRFATAEWLFRINDRLAAPNEAAVWTSVQAALAAFCGGLFTGADVKVEPVGEPRQLLSARISVSPAPTLAALGERLGVAVS
jgi:hypothetical protein